MTRKPRGYWDIKENRINAVKELKKKLKKPAKDIRKKDFIDNGLSSLLDKYNGSYKKALIEAGFKPSISNKSKKELRIKKVKEIINELNKPIFEIKKKDFMDKGINNLIKNMTLKEILEEAGYEYEPLRRVSGYWNIRENRIKETKKLVEKLGKLPKEIKKSDFNDNGLSTLLAKYRGSVSKALRDAGFTELKNIKPNGYWNIKENRIKATRELFLKLGKKPNEIQRRDFEENGLESLLNKYKPSICAEYERGFLLTWDKGYLLKYKTACERALAEAGIIK